MLINPLDLKKRNAIFYRPFGPLSGEGSEQPGEREVETIESLITAGKWYEARQESAQLIQTSLAGLRYLQTYVLPSLFRFVSLKTPRYDQTLIRAMVVIAYLGWTAYGATTILFPNHPPSFSAAISGVALVVLGISWTLFAVQKYPLTFFVYAVFPCYFWREVLVKCSGPLLEMYRSDKLRGSAKLFFRAVFVIAALQSMVVCASLFPYTVKRERAPIDLHIQVGYTHRGVWSIGFLALGFIWPAWRWMDGTLKEPPVTCLTWTLLCSIAAVFPMLDVNQSESLGLM